MNRLEAKRHAIAVLKYRAPVLELGEERWHRRCAFGLGKILPLQNTLGAFVRAICVRNLREKHALVTTPLQNLLDGVRG